MSPKDEGDRMLLATSVLLFLLSFSISNGQTQEVLWLNHPLVKDCEYRYIKVGGCERSEGQSSYRQRYRTIIIRRNSNGGKECPEMYKYEACNIDGTPVTTSQPSKVTTSTFAVMTSTAVVTTTEAEHADYRFEKIGGCHYNKHMQIHVQLYQCVEIKKTVATGKCPVHMKYERCNASDSMMTTQRPKTIATTKKTTKRPQTIATTRRTTQRPKTIATTRKTTQRPKTIATTRKTTQRPETIATTRRTTRRPKTVTRTARTPALTIATVKPPSSSYVKVGECIFHAGAGTYMQLYRCVLLPGVKARCASFFKYERCTPSSRMSTVKPVPTTRTTSRPTTTASVGYHFVKVGGCNYYSQTRSYRQILRCVELRHNGNCPMVIKYEPCSPTNIATTAKPTAKDPISSQSFRYVKVGGCRYHRKSGQYRQRFRCQVTRVQGHIKICPTMKKYETCVRAATTAKTNESVQPKMYRYIKVGGCRKQGPGKIYSQRYRCINPKGPGEKIKCPKSVKFEMCDTPASTISGSGTQCISCNTGSRDQPTSVRPTNPTNGQNAGYQ